MSSPPVTDGDANYKAYPASTSSTALAGASGAGAQGDYLKGVLVIPASVSPGAVTVTDGSTAIIIFAGGTTSLADLKSFFVPVLAKSVNGPWKITTGTNVSVIATGSFS